MSDKVYFATEFVNSKTHIVKSSADLRYVLAEIDKIRAAGGRAVLRGKRRGIGCGYGNYGAQEFGVREDELRESVNMPRPELVAEPVVESESVDTDSEPVAEIEIETGVEYTFINSDRSFEVDGFDGDSVRILWTSGPNENVAERRTLVDLNQAIRADLLVRSVDLRNAQTDVATFEVGDRFDWNRFGTSQTYIIEHIQDIAGRFLLITPDGKRDRLDIRRAAQLIALGCIVPVADDEPEPTGPKLTYPGTELSDAKLRRLVTDSKRAADELRPFYRTPDFETVLVDASYDFATDAFGESQYDERPGGGSEKWQTYRERLEFEVRYILANEPVDRNAMTPEQRYAHGTQMTADGNPVVCESCGNWLVGSEMYGVTCDGCIQTAKSAVSDDLANAVNALVVIAENEIRRIESTDHDFYGDDRDDHYWQSVAASVAEIQNYIATIRRTYPAPAVETGFVDIDGTRFGLPPAIVRGQLFERIEPTSDGEVVGVVVTAVDDGYVHLVRSTTERMFIATPDDFRNEFVRVPYEPDAGSTGRLYLVTAPDPVASFGKKSQVVYANDPVSAAMEFVALHPRFGARIMVGSVPVATPDGVEFMTSKKSPVVVREVE